MLQETVYKRPCFSSSKFHLQVLCVVSNNAFQMCWLKHLNLFFKLYQEQGKYYEPYFVLEILLNWLVWVHVILIRINIPCLWPDLKICTMLDTVISRVWALGACGFLCCWQHLSLYGWSCWGIGMEESFLSLPRLAPAWKEMVKV